MMKTLQELYNEVIQSDELKKEFLEAGKNGTAEAFLKAHGCDATLDEIKAFLEDLMKSDKELSADELENAAGGTCNETTGFEVFSSVITVGISCAVTAISSAVNEFRGFAHVGQENDNDGRICNDNK